MGWCAGSGQPRLEAGEPAAGPRWAGRHPAAPQNQRLRLLQGGGLQLTEAAPVCCSCLQLLLNASTCTARTMQVLLHAERFSPCVLPSRALILPFHLLVTSLADVWGRCSTGRTPLPSRAWALPSTWLAPGLPGAAVGGAELSLGLYDSEPGSAIQCQDVQKHHGQGIMCRACDLLASTTDAGRV